MEIKIKLGGWGRKGQHTAQEVGRNLEVQVQVLTEALRAERAKNAELEKQLAEALSARIAKGRRLAELGQGGSATRAALPVPPVRAPARFQGTTGVVGPIRKVE